MKVSLNWLKEYLVLPHSPEEIANAMTLAGLEVEGMDTIGDDLIFEIGLTPNLGHCMSILGIARELSAILQIPLHKKEPLLEEGEKKISVRVENHDEENCLAYFCREVRGIEVGPSPNWLKNRLESLGMRSVNNIVDISNYVMLECGQPLHMFDADQVEKGSIHIRRANADGVMTTLDGMERNIPDGILLICDEKRPIAFAGVMGENQTSVTDATKNILIESAHFSEVMVRKASKLLNLRTESSQRFERGIDPLGVKKALDRAASLVQELLSTAISSHATGFALPYTPHKITLSPHQANRLLGIHLSVREICFLLGRLEIEVLSDQKDLLTLQVPSYRNDLKTEIDLIEEVGRMYGFNHIPRSIPKHASSTMLHSPLYVFEEKVREILMGEGLQEFLTCDLISPKEAEWIKEKKLSEQTQIHVLHPASIDQSVLRTSLLPGLMNSIRYNIDQQNVRLAAFEVGHIHFKQDETYYSEPSVGIILSGTKAPYHFASKPAEVDFFDLKGLVENLLESLHIQNASFALSHLQNFHPGRQAHIQKEDLFLGALGEIHPAHCRQWGIDQRVYYAELNLSLLMKLMPSENTLTPLPLYPKTERDWTITLPDHIGIAEVLDSIKQYAPSLLENVYLLDLFRSEKIGKENKNVTFRFQYRDRNKTISYEDVEKIHTNMIEHIAKKYSFV